MPRARVPKITMYPDERSLSDYLRPPYPSPTPNVEPTSRPSSKLLAMAYGILPDAYKRLLDRPHDSPPAKFISSPESGEFLSRQGALGAYSPVGASFPLTKPPIETGQGGAVLLAPPKRYRRTMDAPEGIAAHELVHVILDRLLGKGSVPWREEEHLADRIGFGLTGKPWPLSFARTGPVLSGYGAPSQNRDAWAYDGGGPELERRITDLDRYLTHKALTPGWEKLVAPVFGLRGPERPPWVLPRRPEI